MSQEEAWNSIYRPHYLKTYSKRKLPEHILKPAPGSRPQKATTVPLLTDYERYVLRLKSPDVFSADDETSEEESQEEPLSSTGTSLPKPSTPRVTKRRSSRSAANLQLANLSCLVAGASPTKTPLRRIPARRLLLSPTLEQCATVNKSFSNLPNCSRLLSPLKTPHLEDPVVSELSSKLNLLAVDGETVEAGNDESSIDPFSIPDTNLSAAPETHSVKTSSSPNPKQISTETSASSFDTTKHNSKLEGSLCNGHNDVELLNDSKSEMNSQRSMTTRSVHSSLESSQDEPSPITDCDASAEDTRQTSMLKDCKIFIPELIQKTRKSYTSELKPNPSKRIMRLREQDSVSLTEPEVPETPVSSLNSTQFNGMSPLSKLEEIKKFSKGSPHIHINRLPIQCSSQGAFVSVCSESVPDKSSEELEQRNYRASKLNLSNVERRELPNEAELDNESGEEPKNKFMVYLPGKKLRRSLIVLNNLGDLPERQPTSRMTPKGRNYSKSRKHIIRLNSIPSRNSTMRDSLRRSSLTARRSEISFRSQPFFNDTCPPQSHNFSLMHSTIKEISDESISCDEPLSKTNYTLISETVVDYEQVVLELCGLREPVGFADVLDDEAYNGAAKIGEGVYGEVFSIQRLSSKTVLKVIPIEGDLQVNSAAQKTYAEIYTELLITRKLSDLKAGFVHLINSAVVRGKYPQQLLNLWDEYDNTNGSENERPEMFEESQLFLILELSNGGIDLEKFTFSTARQAFSIFQQLAFSLALAEIELEFEHRDLHWGNVLIAGTTEAQKKYIISGQEYNVATHGVEATIIDCTLSRITYGDKTKRFPIFNDLNLDPGMFQGDSKIDYQFEVYRIMRQDVGGDWSRFEPKTNVRWLHYLADKIVKEVNYRKGVRNTKAFKELSKVLNLMIKDVILSNCNCDNSVAIARDLYHHEF